MSEEVELKKKGPFTWAIMIQGKRVGSITHHPFEVDRFTFSLDPIIWRSKFRVIHLTNDMLGVSVIMQKKVEID